LSPVNEHWDPNKKQSKDLKYLAKYQETQDDFCDIEVGKDFIISTNRTAPSPSSGSEDSFTFTPFFDDEHEKDKETDEEWSCLEIPKGDQLNLVELKPQSTENLWELSGSEGNEEIEIPVTTKIIEEEEWSDVEIPSDLSTMKLKTQKSAEEEWSDVELPQNGLQLGAKPAIGETDTSEDEWSDIELPQNTYDLKLKLSNLNLHIQ